MQLYEKYSINSHIQAETLVQFDEINAYAIKDSYLESTDTTNNLYKCLFLIYSCNKHLTNIHSVQIFSKINKCCCKITRSTKGYIYIGRNYFHITTGDLSDSQHAMDKKILWNNTTVVILLEQATKQILISSSLYGFMLQAWKIFYLQKDKMPHLTEQCRIQLSGIWYQPQRGWPVGPKPRRNNFLDNFIIQVKNSHFSAFILKSKSHVLIIISKEDVIPFQLRIFFSAYTK